MGMLGPTSRYQRGYSRFGIALSAYWPHLVFCILIMAIGDFALCAFGPLPFFWAQLSAALPYVGVVIAAARFGTPIGLVAAVVAGGVHSATVNIGCNQANSQLDHWLMFAVFAFVTGWMAKSNSIAPMYSGSIASASQEYGRGSSTSGPGRLMPDVAHQFVTPIASIEGAAFVLADTDVPDDKRIELAGIIRKECQRLEFLIGRSDALHSPTPAYSEGDVKRTLDAVIAELPNIDPGITVRNLAPVNLPLLRYEPELLKHTLQTLVLNAIRAIPQRGDIALSAEYSPGEICLRVEAHADSSPESFEPSLTETLNMTDLAVVREIITRHGGALRLQPNGANIVSIIVILPRTNPASL